MLCTGRAIVIFGRFLAQAAPGCNPLRVVRGELSFRMWFWAVFMRLYLAKLLGYSALLGFAAEFTWYALADPWWTCALLMRRRREAAEFVAVLEWVKRIPAQKGHNLKAADWKQKVALFLAGVGPGGEIRAQSGGAASSRDDGCYGTLQESGAPRAAMGRPERAGDQKGQADATRN